MAAVYDTSALPVSQQFEFYREVLCDTFMRMRAERREQGPWRARMSADRYGDMTLVGFDLPRHMVIRGPEEIAKADSELVFVHMIRGGRVLHDHRGAHEAATAGQVLMSDSTRPLHAVIPERFETTILAFPRQALTARMPAFEGKVGVAMDARRGGAALLKAFVRALRRHGEELGPAERANAARQLADMVAAAFGPVGEEAAPGLALTRLQALLAFIDERLEDPGLSARAAAARFGFSPRYVAKLFEPSGATFGETVQAKRLERAMAALQAEPGRTVAETAFACGFHDLSTFNRSFKRRYGVTPSEVRAEARAHAENKSARMA